MSAVIASVIVVGLIAFAIWICYALSHFFDSRSSTNLGDRLTLVEAFRGDYEVSASGNIRLNRHYAPGEGGKTYPYLCDYCLQHKDAHFEGPGLWFMHRQDSHMCPTCKRTCREWPSDLPLPSQFRHQLSAKFGIVNPDPPPSVEPIIPTGSSPFSPTPPTSPPASPPSDIVPPVEPHQIGLEELLQLRSTAMHEFRNHPLKHTPAIFIQPSSHFPPRKDALITLAHYETGSRIICFRAEYVEKSDVDALMDTMIHEHIHAWMHENPYDSTNSANPQSPSYLLVFKQLDV
jgi:hypothetical protein